MKLTKKFNQLAIGGVSSILHPVYIWIAEWKCSLWTPKTLRSNQEIPGMQLNLELLSKCEQEKDFPSYIW